MSELLPCPFCGGEANTLHRPHVIDWRYSVGCNDDECRGFIGLSWLYKTEAEAIAAWNSRAPIEYDGWFYLPKPKEGIVDYGEPEITRTENGYKVRQVVDVVDEAARKWGDELGEYVMRRICEIWNSRAERTCKQEERGWSTEGDHARVWLTCGHDCMVPTVQDLPNYCPNCGAKVVDA